MKRLILTTGFAAALLVASATEVGAAERSVRPSVARRFTNPFSIPRVSRFTNDRFGLPALASEPVFATPVAVSSPAPTPQAVGSSEEELAFTPLSWTSTSRPPFRPTVRSPFRPPPRPPF